MASEGCSAGAPSGAAIAASSGQGILGIAAALARPDGAGITADVGSIRNTAGSRRSDATDP